MAKIDWSAKASNLLKSELKRRGLTYADLVQKLDKIGIPEKEVNIRNKLSRGTFTAAYFLQVLEALGVKELRL